MDKTGGGRGEKERGRAEHSEDRKRKEDDRERKGTKLRVRMYNCSRRDKATDTHRE